MKRGRGAPAQSTRGLSLPVLILNLQRFLLAAGEAEILLLYASPEYYDLGSLLDRTSHHVFACIFDHKC